MRRNNKAHPGYKLQRHCKSDCTYPLVSYATLDTCKSFWSFSACCHHLLNHTTFSMCKCSWRYLTGHFMFKKKKKEKRNITTSSHKHVVTLGRLVTFYSFLKLVNKFSLLSGILIQWPSCLILNNKLVQQLYLFSRSWQQDHLFLDVRIYIQVKTGWQTGNTGSERRRRRQYLKTGHLLV